MTVDQNGNVSSTDGQRIWISETDGVSIEALHGRAGPGPVLKALVEFAERRMLRDAEEQGLTDVQVTNVRIIVEGQATKP